MNKKLLVITISLIGIGFISTIGIRWANRFFKIDKCLDSGGSWNYELKRCEGSYNLDLVKITDFYWHTDFDTTLNREYILRGKLLDSIPRNPDELINILNRRKSNCKIEFLKMTGDSISIRILDDEYLTEQMGSSGAMCYLAETVFTLTENDLIKFVRIEMDYGSHASPGLYTRDNFKDMIIK
jgi:hypothetical protein